MKVLELEIKNVRGIRELVLRPEGANLVIWGPNGSGKSAVVDALDFLLTGRISRLMGKGTAGITLSKHGPHIDHDPEKATVRAKIRVAGLVQPIELRRCMARPSVLECSAVVRPKIQPIIAMAEQGQHVLTRRDILRYITAEASTRAAGIHELLNLIDIEDVRRALVRVKNDAEGSLRNARASLNTASAGTAATLQTTTVDTTKLLAAINQARAQLSGEPLTSVRSDQLKKGLAPPASLPQTNTLNVAILERDVGNLRRALDPTRATQTGKTDTELRETISTVRSDPAHLHALSHLPLIELGVTLIDDTGACPLCETAWPPGRLREHLDRRLAAASVAKQHQARISGLASTLNATVDTTIASLEKVIEAARRVDLAADLPFLQSWISDLRTLRTALAVPLDQYPVSRFASPAVERMLAPAELSDILARLDSAVNARFPKATPEQTAWDLLTRLEENIKAIEAAHRGLQRAELVQRRAARLLGAFQAARDQVLSKLYDDVRDRFVELYRALHGEDEADFDATLRPEGAGLTLEVDFYGRGTHPPHALHSEGHQDSMGLCLYLVLAEKLIGTWIDLIILDDVVMSVDTSHRRQVCYLLNKFFPNKQFLITTHDKTWANQLKTDGVVTSSGLVEFYNWRVETGPQVNYQTEMWVSIEEDLKRGDVPTAAARLRRGSEQFFGLVCDSLQAPVTYKLDGRWELGDFLPAAIGKYRSLLRQAKKAADSWGDHEKAEVLKELESTAGQIITRSNAEQWAVNVNVHYNNWANFSESDFRPVVEAFQDLHRLFVCNNCGALLRAIIAKRRPTAVRCSCAKVDWNLIEKPQSS